MTDSTVPCPHCGVANEDDAGVCSSCGKPLAGARAGTADGDGPTMGFSGQSDGDGETIGFSGNAGGDDHTVGLGAEGRAAVAKAATAPKAAGPLQPGSTLGGRYRIDAELGTGGMGSVYRAQDLELERTVALKVIRPVLADDPEVLQRFKHEIILARGITHRNVVRIFDLGQADDVKFISMEYVEGTDLASLLRQRGPLTPDEAVGIVEQICLALDAAHSEGVVHRDLKPQNIMLTPDDRVVVMDFGIARSLELSGMTQTGSLLGTPDYMSPEQVKGEQVDARSDLFALGIIFYQLLTGALPYQGETPMATMFKRTQVRASPVRDLKPELPGFLSDVVSRCLEIAPHKRYQSARELLQDLNVWRGGTAHMTIGPTMRAFRPTTTVARKRMRMAGIGFAALVLAGIVAGGVLLLRSRPAGEGEAAAQAAAQPALSLAILPFRNASQSADLDWLRSGLAEMLDTDVGQSAAVRTISPDRVHQVLGDLQIQPGAALEEVTLRRIVEFANADTVVWGQFAKVGDQIRIDATLRDFKEHRTVPLKVEVAGEEQLLRGVQELAQQVRANLALSKGAVRELEKQAFIPTSGSVRALRSYNQGLEQIRGGNNLEAVQSFEAAVADDSKFALAYAKLAQAYLALGRGTKAEEASRQAVDMSSDLPEQERFLILAQNARVENDYEAGIDAYKNLLRLRPSDPELHYELGVLYEDQGAFDDARQHLEEALAADPRNVTAQIAYGRVLIKSGQVQDSLAPLNQALSLAIQVDNKEARANALQALGIAYRYLGKADEALKHFNDSLEIKKQIGDKRGMAASLSMIGQVDAGSQNLQAATASFQQAIAISRDIGDDQGLAGSLMDLGEVERLAGSYQGALDHTREALRIQMELGDDWNQSQSLNNIGTIYDLQGQYGESLVYYQQALEIRKKLADPTKLADTLHNMAETYTSMGRYQEAIDHYLQALENRRSATDERGAATESYSLGRVYEYQGRYGAALKSVTDALDIFNRLQDRSAWYVEARAGYGNLLALLGRFDEAKKELDATLEAARGLGDDLLVAKALDFDGDRLYYSGDFTGAVGRYREAAKAAETAGDPYLVISVKAGLARAELAAGRAREALPRLEQAITEAQSRGARYLAARCTVCLGSALIDTGDPGRAQVMLQKALGQAEEMGAQPLLAQSHYLLAEAFRSASKPDEAADHLRKAGAILDAMEKDAGGDSLLQRTDLAPIAKATAAVPASG